MISKEVIFMGAFQSTGYGIASMGVGRGLHESGHDVYFHDICNSRNIGTTYFNSQTDSRILLSLQNKMEKFPYDAPCVRMWHQFSMDLWVGRGPKFGWPIFELDKFSDIEKHHLGYPDELIVCSKWAADIIQQELDRKAHVVPLGVDTTIFSPGSQERDSNKPFVFLNIGKWEVRKGHDILADIYNMAFRPDDNVELHVLAPLWASQDERNDWMNYYRDTPMGDSIKFLERQPTHKHIAHIMQNADCGIFPARAEGWNLELLEMMATGRPVIALNYGAHKEYCEENNSYLVDVDELELAADGKWFTGQGQWACIGDKQLKELAEHMRYVYENWSFNTNGVETGKKFSWINSAKALAKIL